MEQALFTEKTIIAAVRSKKEFDAALNSRSQVIFLLSGTISELPAFLHAAHKCSKKLFLHLDMIEGLAGDAAGVEYAAGLARTALSAHAAISSSLPKDTDFARYSAFSLWTDVRWKRR